MNGSNYLKKFKANSHPDIEQLRKKKHVIQDLKDLEKMGYIEINTELGVVYLTPLIGYQLDFEKLFIKLSLNLKEKKINIQ